MGSEALQKMARLFFLAALLAVGYAKPKEDERACEVCKAVIDEIDKLLTVKDREDVESVEKVMQKYCDTTKGKDKTMCYYMGIGDATSGTAGGVKRDISSSLTRGINAKRLCNRLKTKDAQMCDLKKLRVKELRKICDDEGINTKGLMEKDEFIKA